MRRTDRERMKLEEEEFGSLKERVISCLCADLEGEEEEGEEFATYAADPVAFGMNVLGNRFTSSIEQVMASVRDNPVTIARSGNSVGKSHGAARIALWWYLCFPDSQVYLAAAPPERNLRIVWNEMLSVVQKFPDLFMGHEVGAQGIKRVGNPLSFISLVTIPVNTAEHIVEASFSGKHAPHLLFIVDEADAVPDAVFRGIESCMTGGMSRLLCMFNPRSRFGKVYEMETNRRAKIVQLSAFEHPNVVTGEDVFPGAVSRETTVRRINEWSEAIPPGASDMAEFDVPECLVGATAAGLDGTRYAPLEGGKRRSIEPAFDYMVLGRYSPLGTLSNWYNVSYLNRLLDEGIEEPVEIQSPYTTPLLNGTLRVYERPLPGVRYVIGADVAEGERPGKGRDFSAFVVGRADIHKVVAVYTSQCDIYAFADDLYRTGVKYGSALVCVERNAVGVGVCKRLEEGNPGENMPRYPNLYRHRFLTAAMGQPAEYTVVGWVANAQTKALRDERLQELVSNQAKYGGEFIQLTDREVIEQLIHYVIKPSGRREGEGSWHDDLNTAAGLMALMFEQGEVDYKKLHENMQPSVPKTANASSHVLRPGMEDVEARSNPRIKRFGKRY